VGGARAQPPKGRAQPPKGRAQPPKARAQPPEDRVQPRKAKPHLQVDDCRLSRMSGVETR